MEVESIPEERPRVHAFPVEYDDAVAILRDELHDFPGPLSEVSDRRLGAVGTRKNLTDVPADFR